MPTLRRDLDPIHVEAGAAAVIGRGQMLPLPRHRALARVEVIGHAAVHHQLVVAGQVVDPEHRTAAAPAAEHGDVLLDRLFLTQASSVKPLW